MFLTKLALKNLIRHRHRTLITACIIAAAAFFYLLFDSLIVGMTEMSYETLIDYETGHLQIVDRDYWEEEEKLPLEDLLPLRDLVALPEVDGELGRSPELNFPARLSNGINELPVIGKGIIPEELMRVFPLKDKFVAGSMFALGEYKAVMGKRLADLLDLQVGDFITLLVRDKNETFNTIEAEIAGLIHTINPNVNQNVVYVPLDIAGQALAAQDEASKMIIRLKDKDKAVAAARKLEAALPGTIGAYPWSELEAVTLAGAKNAGIMVMTTILLFIAAIAIINTVILAALERMGEIGMMKAMGLQEKEIIYLFVTESVGIGVLGGLVGILLGLIGVGLLVRIGIDWSALMDIDMSSFGIPVLGKMYGVWNPAAFLMIFSFGIVVSLLASIVPAYWAAAKDPIEAIDYR
ncbi:MAG: ABC transporter permease [Limnochordia bacterium]|nr:ABC transporter permease [Bacillota bacterium]